MNRPFRRRRRSGPFPLGYVQNIEARGFSLLREMPDYWLSLMANCRSGWVI